ncbi:MAG: PAS domain S-box protein [Rhodocyclaceae bacterium]|nr:PAS domain S-box protein [Rhodocyclaceae bacterium]
MNTETQISLLDEAGVGTWEFDHLSGRFSWSPFIASLFGVAADQLPQDGESLRAALHPDDRQSVREAAVASMRQDAPMEQKCRVRCGDAWLWVRFRGRVTARRADGWVLRSAGVVMDITHLEETESALQRERQRLRTLLDTIPDLVWLKDPDGVYICCNRRFSDLYGAPEADIVGKDDYAFVPRKLADFFREHDRMAAAAGHPCANDEWVTFANDGHRALINTIKTPMFDEAGGLVGVLGVARDITPLHDTQQALEKIREQFAVAFRASPLSICISEIETGRHVDVNDAFCKLFGFTHKEACGHTSLELGMWPDPSVRAAWREALRAGGCRDYRTTMCHRDGREFRCSLSAEVIELNGQPHILAYATDVTEAEQAAEQLRRRERYQRALLDNFPFLVWLKDAESRFLAVNQPFAKACGATSVEDLVGKTDLDVWPRDLAQRYRADDREVLGNAISKCVEELVEVAGERRWIETFKSPVTVDGKMVGTVGFARDITERRASAEELDQHRHHLEEIVAERTAELEAANRAKSTFLANMSHEIRTPMNAIIGLNQLLLRDDPSPTQLRRLDKLGMAAKHLLAIINDLLDISRIEADSMPLDVADMEIAGLVDDAFALIHDAAHAKGLTLTRAIDPQLPARVRGDATRVGQILFNYVANAVKFTERGSIGIHVIREGVAGAGIVARFEVRDTGIGVEPQHQGRLFTAFEQGDPSTTRKYGGTGLGLAISRRLAELMGGSVGMESTPGRGSCFWFTVRLAPAASVASAAPKSSADDDAAILARDFSHARVLLVEDNEVNQDVALELLADAGIHAELAEDGRQAVAMHTARPYALILMDMQMPVMDGLDATRAIRAQAVAPDVPIVAMTANAFAEDRTRCLAAGMNDYLAKPFSPDILYAMLRQWLSRAG